MIKTIKHQAAFTLVELLIAITLGLIIVAAGLSLFINGLRGSQMQQGAMQVQDSGIFGLEYIANQVRLANYANVENRSLNDQTPFGGVVLTTGLPSATNVNLAVGAGNNTTLLTNTALTQSSGATGWTGSSNVNIGSDQLTVQFVAPMDMFNCEGAAVRKGDRVIQRYFVRQDANRTNYDTNLQRLSLACDANTPTATTAAVQSNPTVVNGFSAAQNGEIIMPDVDYFGFLLGVRIDGGLQYFTVNQYKTAAAAARTATPVKAAPAIELIKIAVLVKSSDDVKFSDINPNQTYSILGQTITLKAPATQTKTNKFARRVYVKTIALRNALGDESL